ncbi:hypothetical protein HSE3_gp006 [Bacillus phage vB_BceM-HSE3]|nr:hypothetical protein HSE3_gp006 [Bacillus phage vB_BceM-HSE3]
MSKRVQQVNIGDKIKIQGEIPSVDLAVSLPEMTFSVIDKEGALGENMLLVVPTDNELKARLCRTRKIKDYSIMVSLDPRDTEFYAEVKVLMKAIKKPVPTPDF